MIAQMFQESRNILLRGVQQHAMPSFDELGKRFQIAVVRFARQRAQAFSTRRYVW